MTNEFASYTYLADGVYAAFDGYGINLKTPRESETHNIYLEPETLHLLLEYAKKHGMIDSYE